MGPGAVADAKQGASAIVVAMSAIWLVNVGRVRWVAGKGPLFSVIVVAKWVTLHVAVGLT